MRKVWLVALAAVLCVSVLAAGSTRGQEAEEAEEAQEAREAVWLEGEHASDHNFNQHSWYDNVKKKLLSGGDWLCHFDAALTGAAEWRFTVKEGGTYTWWIRLNPFEIKHLYSLDGGELKPLEPEKLIGESTNIAPQAIDIRFIQWARVGQVELEPGEHSVMLMVQPGQREAHGGIDCMAFVNYDWQPAGIERPGPAGELTEEERKKQFQKLLKLPLADAVHKVVGEKEFFWMEGEEASDSSFIEHPWYHSQELQKMILSGREWLSHFNASMPGTAHWKFIVAKEGKFDLWLRANTTRNKIEYRIDTHEPVALEVEKEDEIGRMNVSQRLEIRFISWVKAAELELEPGPHVLSLTLSKSSKEGDEDVSHHGAVDCLCLTNFEWKPVGTQKPKIEEKKEEPAE
ncbi:MAG: hypothetical protein R6V05_12665 [Candidatus Brocadiia bacterium]